VLGVIFFMIKFAGRYIKHYQAIASRHPNAISFLIIEGAADTSGRDGVGILWTM
jgi:hypothetical protein